MAVHDFRSQRLFVDAPLHGGAEVACERGQANYLRNVLRLGDGAAILVFNGRDGEWRARLSAHGKRDCSLCIEDQVREQAGGPKVRYLFAPLKRARLDYMVQKATEMGVESVEPVITRRTVAERVNLERMRANVIEAAEQCGVLRIPRVAEPVRLEACLAGWPADHVLFFADEASEAGNPIEVFAGIERGAPAGVLIGPEGGFSEEERARIRAMPATRTVSLGPRIMRADTAAVALLALVSATIGDWDRR
jgi:16S rRNA (uracil1498-N3)-methyltransferase